MKEVEKERIVITSNDVEKFEEVMTSYDEAIENLLANRDYNEIIELCEIVSKYESLFDCMEANDKLVFVLEDWYGVYELKNAVI